MVNASTECNPTEETIDPMGEFPNYGVIDQDYIMIRGCVMGRKKGIITIRKVSPTTVLHLK